MTLISLLFLIFIFFIQTIEATGPKDLNPEKTKAEANLSQSSAASGAKEKIDLKKEPAKTKKDLEKQKKALFKQIILEDASFPADFTDSDKKYIQDQSRFKDILISEGLKIIVQDDQLKSDGALKDFYNPNKIKALLNETEFIEKIMEAIKSDHKLTEGYSYSLKMGDADTGTFKIYFYKNAAKFFKSMIIRNLANCRDLDKSEIAALKADSKIYDSKYISDACEIDIQSDLYKSFSQEDIERIFDIYFKQEIADQLNKPNLNLDKHMSVYLKLNKTEGNLKITLAETRSLKLKEEPVLRESLDNYISKNYPPELIDPLENNLGYLEGIYGKYLNLYVLLFINNNQIQPGSEFGESLGLINEILNTESELRKKYIDRANYKLDISSIQEDIPNDMNTIIHSRFNQYGNFIMEFFTLTDSPKGAIQSRLLDDIDYRIYWQSYESIRSSDDIEDIEAERSLKQGLKIVDILEYRLEEGGSLSRYYNNSKSMNKLLDDADFKRKVVDKINNYQKNDEEFEELKEELKSPFSKDNLDDIKIKAQNFRKENEFDLVIYELEPK